MAVALRSGDTEDSVLVGGNTSVLGLIYAAKAGVAPLPMSLGDALVRVLGPDPRLAHPDASGAAAQGSCLGVFRFHPERERCPAPDPDRLKTAASKRPAGGQHGTVATVPILAIPPQSSPC